MAFNVHQHGLFIYHPFRVRSWLSGPSAIRFEEIEKVVSQDQSSFFDIWLTIMRVLKRHSANLAYDSLVRNIVICRKRGRNLTVLSWEDIYTAQSRQNLLNTPRRHGVEVSLTGY